MDGFQICEGDNLERENSFYLRGSDSPNGPSRLIFFKSKFLLSMILLKSLMFRHYSLTAA